VPASYAGAAMAETGQSIQQSGLILQKIGEQRRKAQQVIEILEKEAGFHQELFNLKQSLTADPNNYEAASAKASKEIESLKGKWLKEVKDPEVRTVLQRSFMRPSLSAQQDVNEWANKQRTDRGIAALDNSIAQYSRLYHTANRDEDKAAILGKIKGAIEGAAAVGFISRDKAGDLWRKTQEDVMETEIMGMARQNPFITRQKLEDPSWAAALEPERRERLLGQLDRKIEQLNRQAERQENRDLRAQDRADKEAEKQLNEKQEKAFDEAAAKQAKNQLSLSDIQELRERREVNENGYRRLMERHGRDLERAINENESYLDGVFRTRGPLEALDPTNEFYRAGLKKELRDRVRQGEDPDLIIDDIVGREMVKPKSPSAYARPIYLEGPKDTLNTTAELNDLKGRLEHALARTKEAYEKGELDKAGALRETRRIKDLLKSVDYEYGVVKAMETKKK
jgi:hypothetical protein